MKYLIVIYALLFMSCKKEAVQYPELKLDSEIKILMYIFEATPGEIESLNAEFTLQVYYAGGTFASKTISEKTPVIKGNSGTYKFLVYGNTKALISWRITKNYKNGTVSTEEGKTDVLKFYPGGHTEQAIPF